MRKTDAQRAREYRARNGATPRGELKPCGTVAAARRHQRAEEPLCGPCRLALAAYQHEQYRKRTKA